MPLRYAGSCAVCGAALPKGTSAYWNAQKKKVTCLACLEPEIAENAIDRGTAGATAAREWHRRHDRREQRVREQYGRLAGLVLALTDDPQSTTAWAYGANGERALGAQLDALRQEGMAVIHDRRLPGSRGNIDHLVIAPSGVFVVDAKNYKGCVERIDRGGWFSTDYRLYVRRRDKTSLIGGMRKQVEAVEVLLGPDPASARIIPVVCFVGADWPFFASPLLFGDVHVLWPEALFKLLRTEGTLSVVEIARIERTLALSLRAA